MDRVAVAYSDSGHNQIDNELTENEQVQKPASPFVCADQDDQGHGEGHSAKDQEEVRKRRNDEAPSYRLSGFFFCEVIDMAAEPPTYCLCHEPIGYNTKYLVHNNQASGPLVFLLEHTHPRHDHEIVVQT